MDSNRLFIVFSIVTLFVTLSGIRHAYDRTMQDTCVNMPFQPVTPAPVVGEFLWPVPMLTGRREIIRGEDCDQVIGIIRSQSHNVFVLGDWKVLYAAAGRASTDPLLWYHRGITYSSAYDPAIDAWMVENLKQKNVGVVIVENSTWLTSGEDNLDYFRQFHTFLQSHYRPTRYGVFEVYTRQNP